MSTIAAIPDREEQLHKQIGGRRTDALRQIAALEGTLRHIDELRAALEECNVTYSVDLGPIGNAAANARRAAAADAEKTSFSLSKAS